MKVRSHLKTIMLLVLCCTLVFTLALLNGCKGKDGEAGTAGADGTSVSLNDCNGCHHLNSLVVNEFDEIFVASLAGADKVITGGSVTTDRQATLTFDATKLPAGETASTFVWTRTNGQAATISGGTTSVAAVTLPVIANYKTELARHIKGLIVTNSSGTVLSDRARIVPVNNQNLDEASSATFKLRVGAASGKFYYTLVRVAESSGEATVANFAAIATGISNVPVGVPVLLRSTNTGTYNWSFVSKPTGTAVLNGATTQFADFKPDVAGQYVVTDGKLVSANTFTIYAGTWKGVIVGQDANNRPTPDSACTGCHVDGGQAPDKFTPWKNSGHAEILTQNINDTASHWTVAGCAPCHSVGYDPSATNNGFDEAVASTGWTFTHGDPNNWTNMLANFAPAARLANIQCENCHGPQDSLAHETSASAAGPRTTMSADDCGSCHGEPQRHGRFQQWEDSGHANFEVAIAEGLTTSVSTTLRNDCAGCHTAQGFLILLSQLQAGNPLRTIPSNIPASRDTLQPITCQVCHDPHAQGTTSGEPNTAKVRVVDNTPKLPGGFAATGVGRGAICFICHNSRNGGVGTDSFLHQDGDPQFGNLTAYSGPHEACQGDMVLGYNAYFVGSGNYRSPHSLIVDTCTNCHMEQTPPPALLSYNLAGTNHAFIPSLDICKNCHSANVALGPMLQNKVESQLEALEKAIGDKIISRSTGTFKVSEVVDLGSRGSINVKFAATPATVSNIGIASIKGLSVTDLGTDDLAKALWNFYLVEQDLSLGVHNPDFTFAVLGGAMKAVTGIPNTPVISNEL